MRSAQRVQAVARQRRDRHGIAHDRGGAVAVAAPAGSKRSALLRATTRGLSPAPSSSRTCWHRLAVLAGVGVRAVDDLDEDVGPGDLLERGPEGLDELVRQLVDEAHRVGQDDALAVAELDLAAGRVERGEEPVLGARGLRARSAR